MRLRALTYNVHKCVGGLDRVYDPERTAEVIRHSGADVVLLQEVSQGAPRLKSERQVDRLGDLLGMPNRAYFTNVKKLAKGGEYGNAILSRFPMTGVENLDLTIPPKKRRCVLHAEIQLENDSQGPQALHVFSLHLGLAEMERKMQLAKLVASELFLGLDHRTPVLIAGDFNDVWGRLRRLLEPHGFSGAPNPPRTFPAFMPLRALDSMYVRGEISLTALQTSDSPLARAASDHLPLVGDLWLSGAADSPLSTPDLEGN